LVNSRAGKYGRGNRQQGAAMVEMAIVISTFLLLVFVIIEFALVIFHWSRLVEATRAGARYAIVNDPACDIYGHYEGEPGFNKYQCDGNKLDCSGANNEETVEVAGNCVVGSPYDLNDGDAGCMIVEQMRAIQPLIDSPQAKVMITYTCTDAGFAGLTQKIPAVKVGTSEEDGKSVQYNLILPGLLGLDVSITMPAFDTTRTGEDLDTIN
jgi:hypothetical protein